MLLSWRRYAKPQSIPASRAACQRRNGVNTAAQIVPCGTVQRADQFFGFLGAARPVHLVALADSGYHRALRDGARLRVGRGQQRAGEQESPDEHLFLGRNETRSEYSLSERDAAIIGWNPLVSEDAVAGGFQPGDGGVGEPGVLEAASAQDHPRHG